MTQLATEPAAKHRKRLARHIPFALTTLRLMLGPTLVLLALFRPQPALLASCVVAGVLSDIFDGIVARRLGVATPLLRRYDSAVDVVFFLGVFASIWIAHPAIVRAWVWGFALLLVLEACCQGVSLIRFGAMPATHTWCAKCWGLSLCASCTAMLAFGYAGALTAVMVILGCIADLEVIAIMFLSPRPPVDVNSVLVLLGKPAGQLAAANGRSSCNATRTNPK
jgi:phosphatidylserine synthase